MELILLLCCLKAKLSSYEASVSAVEGAASSYLASNRLPVVPVVDPVLAGLSGKVQTLMSVHHGVLPRLGKADVTYWLDKARSSSDFGEASDSLKEAYRATILPWYREVFSTDHHFARGSVLVELACLHAKKSDSTKVCAYLDEAAKYLADSFEGKSALRSGFMRVIKFVEGNVAMALARSYGLSGVSREGCFADDADLAKFRRECDALKAKVSGDWILKF